jgi:hypothetical protein
MGLVVKLQRPMDTQNSAVPQNAPLAQPAKKLSTMVQEVFDFWRQVSGHTRSRRNAKLDAVVAARLREGYSVVDLCDAVSGMMITPFNQGINERDTKYDALELVCRNGAQVNRFLNTWVELARVAIVPEPVVKQTPANPEVARAEIKRCMAMLATQGKWQRGRR